MKLRVLDPRLNPEKDTLSIASPLDTLTGKVFGFIDNAKIGTERFFDHVAEILKTKHGVAEIIRCRKPDASRPIPAAMLASLSAADAILSGIGD